jgi:hypothetical protein
MLLPHYQHVDGRKDGDWDDDREHNGIFHFPRSSFVSLSSKAQLGHVLRVPLELQCNPGRLYAACRWHKLRSGNVPWTELWKTDAAPPDTSNLI